MKTKNPEVENAYKCVACKMSDNLSLGKLVESSILRQKCISGVIENRFAVTFLS